MSLFSRRPPSRRVRTIAIAIVWASAFFVLGYFPLVLAKDARMSVVVLAAAVIPFGASATSAVRGLLRGLGLGIAAGAGMAWAMLVTRFAPPAQLDQLALRWFLAVVFLTTAVASLFAILAQRRRQMSERDWNR